MKIRNRLLSVLSPNILQVSNVMLLVDWLQENDFFCSLNTLKSGIFSSPGRSQGRAIVLPSGSALASAFAKC